MLRFGVAILLVTALATLFTATAFAQTPTCEPVDQSTATVIPGVTLTWDSSFRCNNAPDEGDYKITVAITSHAGNVEAVRIDNLQLGHTTPRPGGQAPDATAEATEDNGTLSISGSYELTETDEGKKANLHLRIVGSGVDSGETFILGVNVHLRGESAEEDEDAVDGDGPPPWMNGPRGAQSMHIQVLTALLERVPEPARLAIAHALRVSDTGRQVVEQIRLRDRDREEDEDQDQDREQDRDWEQERDHDQQGDMPADRPIGPPSDRPIGPPQDRPIDPEDEDIAGPPADRPVGPPSDRPAGPPATVPAGPPPAPPSAPEPEPSSKEPSSATIGPPANDKPGKPDTLPGKR